MSKLLGNWKVVSLADISEIQMGQSPDSSTYNDKRDGLPFFQGKAEFGKLNPTVRKWCSDPKKIAEKGDILLSIRAPVGPSNVAIEKCSIGRGLASLRAINPLNQSYLFHFIRNLEPWLSLQGTGTTFAAVSGDFIRTIEIPIAPLAEQKRITDKLDILLAHVDICRERLKRLHLILKRFKQSVLAAATSGKLTEAWRVENVGNSWIDLKLGDVLREKPRNGYSPKTVDFETSVRSLTLTATTSGKFIGKHCKFIDEPISPTSHLWLMPGDILIQRANSLEYVGVSAIFDGAVNTYIYPDLMMKCRANERILTSYLFIVLSAESTRNYFRKNATGTSGNMPKINQQTVVSVPVHLPSIEEQTEIAHRVESLFGFADRLEDCLTTARNATEHLAPALLAKAFRGELVPQDPTDEPAKVLLDQIKIERLLRQKNNSKTKLKVKITGATMQSKKIISIFDALKIAQKPLSTSELLIMAGYPTEASVDQMEDFFLDIREQLSIESIVKHRPPKSDQDLFELSN